MLCNITYRKPKGEERESSKVFPEQLVIKRHKPKGGNSGTYFN